MAKAQTKIETKVVETTVEEEVVQLTLTKEEATTLNAILWRVSGWDGEGGHRDRLDRISSELGRHLPPRDLSFIKTGMTLFST